MPDNLRKGSFLGLGVKLKIDWSDKCFAIYWRVSIAVALSYIMMAIHIWDFFCV